MHKIISGLALIGVLATPVLAEDKKYDSFESLKAGLLRLAYDKQFAASKCAANRYSGYQNESGNHIRATTVEVIKTNYDDVISAYFKKHMKVKETQKDVVQKCYDIKEGIQTTITFSAEKNNSSSDTVTSTKSSDASFDASLSYGIASIDASYSTAVSKTSTSSKTSGSSDGSSYQTTFTWNKDDGDYRIKMVKNNYSLKQAVTLPVNYTIGKLNWVASCHYKKHEDIGKDMIHSPSYPGISSMSELGKGSELKVTIPTKISFDVSYYDQWPSYEKQHGKTCEQN